MGNILFAIFAYLHLPYYIFVLSMLVAGCGAGLLNGHTVKVISGAVPENRAGMASGLASTTRFIGILVSVAVLGAILSDVANRRFVTVATRLGLDQTAAEAAAKKVTSGDLDGMLASAPENLRASQIDWPHGVLVGLQRGQHPRRGNRPARMRAHLPLRAHRGYGAGPPCARRSHSVPHRGLQGSSLRSTQ